MAGSGAYASALSTVRDTVKWVVAAFTGASAIVFSGLTVTNISKLAETGEWLLPVALAAVPLAAVVVAIFAAQQVITVTPPHLRNLFPKYWKALTGEPTPKPTLTRAQLEQLPIAVAVFGTIDAVDKRLVDAQMALSTAWAALEQSADSNERKADYTAAQAARDALQPTVQEALDCAAYVQAREQYGKSGKWIGGAVLFAVAGLVGSGTVSGALISSQQDDKAKKAATAPPAPVAFHDATPVEIHFVDPGRPPEGSGGPHECPIWDGMPAHAVGGTYSRPLVMFLGYTPAQAEAHLVQASSQCERPWMWSAKPDQVLLTPR